MSDASSGTIRHLPIQGVLWMASAAFFFALSISFVKFLSGRFSTFEIVFFRMVLGVIFMLPWLIRSGAAVLRTQQLGLHLVRNGLSYVAMVASYYSVTLITIADSTALQFTLPLFTLILAMMILKEKVGFNRWLATGVGFLGVLIIIRPGFAEFNVGVLIALAAAALYGGSDVTTRYVSRRDGTTMMVFYGFIIQIPLGIVPAAATWVTPALSDVPWIISFSVVALVAQWCLARSYTVAEASFVSSVLFLRLPFVAVIGYVFFDQRTDIWTWIGALILFASTYYSARKETRSSRAARA